MDDDFVVAELDLLAKLGPRFPGSEAHERLVAHVAAQWAQLGMHVREDVLSFQRWDPPGDPDGLRLTVDGQEVEISSAFPYSGTTGPDGVRGRLRHLRGPLPRWSRARGGIAVVEMIRNRELPWNSVVGSWDPDDPWGNSANPLAPATLAGLGLKHAARAGVKGVVLIWRGVSVANARGQYAPFTLSYRGIPAVFVAGGAADAVLHAAQRGAQAELVLNATLTKNASMRTVWAAVEGTQRPGETVLVVTHSDGTNVVEENGHIGLLQLARDVMAQPPQRTIVFVLTAGHLRIPAVTTGHGQATSRWLRVHRDWWAGGEGQRRAVSGLVIEHLGAREYHDDPVAGDYGPTGQAEPELLYASTRELRMLADIEWRGVEPGPTRVSMPNELIQLGEGQPLYLERIPNISLVTVPQYLLSTEPGDYVDVQLLHGRSTASGACCATSTPYPPQASAASPRTPPCVRSARAAKPLLTS